MICYLDLFLPFFSSGCLRQVLLVLTTYMYFLFCGIQRLAVRRVFLLEIFSKLKRMGPLPTGPTALESDGPYFEIMGQ